VGYFLIGIGGLLYNNYHDPLQKGWAVINQSNLQNSNNVVTSSSYALFYASSTSGLTQYGSTTLWYKIDTDLRTLTVWEDPSTPSFSSYLLEHTATLSQTDIVPLTKTQSNLIKKEVNGLNLLNDDTKIGVIAVVAVVLAVATAIVVTAGAAGVVLGATFAEAAGATAGAGITTVIKGTDVISGKQGANQV
jgi:disulfide bond formation protein DsbB